MNTGTDFNATLLPILVWDFKQKISSNTRGTRPESVDAFHGWTTSHAHQSPTKKAQTRQKLRSRWSSDRRATRTTVYSGFPTRIVMCWEELRRAAVEYVV